MIVNRSSIAACFGRCSQSKTPGSLVGMTPNGPRFWSGRSGLGSQVSMWLGPPAIQSRMTALFAADRPARLGGPGPAAEQARQAQPGQARQARLEHVAAAGDDQALPLQRVEAGEGVPVVVGGHGVTLVPSVTLGAGSRPPYDTPGS